MRITVQSNSGELSFDCSENESILFAGLRQGVSLPYECATGTCGTCRARVMTGEVAVGWKEAPGGKRLKPEKGDILMCQTDARADCALRVPSDVAVSQQTRPTTRHGVIGNIQKLTRDVVHFDLRLSSPMSFHAGQFIVLETGDIVGGRAYSMVSYGTDDRVALVLKRKPDGAFSDWIFDETKQDRKVEVFGPLGRAIFRPDENRNIVCIAGGSGIAGMMSILECATRSDHFRARKGAVFFGVRTHADAFYLDDFSRHVAASHGNLDVTVALSDEAAATARHAEHPLLKLESGMVHEVAGRHMAESERDALYYIAGPPIMVDSAIRGLVKSGVTIKDIRYDKFG